MAEIKFIREYTFYGEQYCDITYKNCGVVSCPAKKLPKTAKAFLLTAKATKEYDKVFNRAEIIYRND